MSQPKGVHHVTLVVASLLVVVVASFVALVAVVVGELAAISLLHVAARLVAFSK